MKKNIIVNLIGKFWGSLSNYLFIPIYIHYLGFQGYSIISFTLVIVGLMSVLDGGLTATLSREFARMDNSLAEKIKVFKTAESLYFIIILISIIILYVFSDLLAFQGLNLKEFNPERISIFIKILSFGCGFQMLLGFYIGGLLGVEKQIEANLYQICWGLVRNGLVVVVIFFIPSLEVFFVWQTISTIIFALLLKFRLNKHLTGKYMFNLMPKIDRAVFRKIWRFSGGVLLISLVASFNSQLDKLAITKFLGGEILGYYTLAVSLSMCVLMIAHPISLALLPRFTALYSIGKSIEASLLFSKVNIYLSIIAFAFMAHMLFFAKELIWIWTGDKNLSMKAHVYLPIVAISYTMVSLTILPYNIAIANGYTKLNNLLGLISLVFTLPCYWFATKYYGGIGVAVVFCIAQILTTLIYLYFIRNKFLKKMPFKSLYVDQIIFPALYSLLISYGFNLVSVEVLESRLGTMLWIGLSFSVCLMTGIYFLVPKHDMLKSKMELFKF